jgi:hypothetical protein
MKKLTIILILLLLNSCASIGSLTGGDKDVSAPQIIKTNLTETEFNKKKILIVFDEYAELNNQTENIKLFPKHSTLSCRMVKKTLEIEFDSTLNKNTTYQILINEGIKDINEGNLYSADFLFSTGKEIDTCKTSFIYDNDKKFKNIGLNVFSNKIDSMTINHYDYQYKMKENKVEIKGLKNDETYYYLLYTDNDVDINFDKNTVYTIDTFSCLNNEIKLKNEILIDTSIKIKRYTNFTKLFKSDLNAFYNKTDSVIYSTKDSALFGAKNTLKDTSVINELRDIIKSGISIIENGSKYSYYIKHYNTNMKILNLKNYVTNSSFYYNKSHTKIDTLNFSIDSIIFQIPTFQIPEIKGQSEIKISNKNEKEFFIIIYKDNIINQTFIIKEKEFEIPIISGDYIIEVYNKMEIKHNEIISPLMYKKINLKPNWTEEITL